MRKRHTIQRRNCLRRSARDAARDAAVDGALVRGGLVPGMPARAVDAVGPVRRVVGSESGDDVPPHPHGARPTATAAATAGRISRRGGRAVAGAPRDRMV